MGEREKGFYRREEGEKKSVGGRYAREGERERGGEGSFINSSYI